MNETIAHPIVARLYDPINRIADRAYLSRHRAALVRGVHGRVLDLGTGTGVMFSHFREAGVSEIHAVEPDPHMRLRAAAKARTSGLSVAILGGRAETLPYRDDSFDFVIASQVFCTIADPQQALEETCRVLRPGAELRILEHVRSNGAQRWLQRAISPIWREVAAGCEPYRATDRRFLAHPDLITREFDILHIGVPPIRPYVRGRFAYAPESDDE